MRECASEITMDYSFLILLGVFLVFMWLMTIPEKRRLKQRQAMLDAIKVGDQIETVSRIYGEVVSVTESDFTIQIGVGSDVRVRINREGIARVIPPAGGEETRK